MTSRRAILTGLGGMTLMAGAYATGAYRAAMAATEARLALRSSVIGTRAGAVEYAIAGRGPPLMMIHGTGGGFDQGLLFAHRLRADGFWAGAPTHTAFDPRKSNSPRSPRSNTKKDREVEKRSADTGFTRRVKAEAFASHWKPSCSSCPSWLNCRI